MRKDVRFNINHYARVKLTEQGLRAYAERQANENMRLRKYRPLNPANTPDGYWRAQAWEIIQFLGPVCGLGMGPLVDCEIIFEVPETCP